MLIWFMINNWVRRVIWDSKNIGKKKQHPDPFPCKIPDLWILSAWVCSVFSGSEPLSYGHMLLFNHGSINMSQLRLLEKVFSCSKQGEKWGFTLVTKLNIAFPTNCVSHQYVTQRKATASTVNLVVKLFTQQHL